jgi:hypothetical protein
MDGAPGLLWSVSREQERATAKCGGPSTAASPSVGMTIFCVGWDLLEEALFAGAEAEDAVDGVGGAVAGGVEVADLELAEQADA